jgi:DNA modification methylase
MGLPDRVLTFRKPGANPEPVGHSKAEFPVDQWQRWASPVWDDINPSDTLQYQSAREERDERHICPLQLEVIRRCIRLWSNPGDLVLSPFAGIGSEGYVAMQENRRFLGCELKPSYFRQAVANLRAAESVQFSLF